jgi:hypothetical protein
MFSAKKILHVCEHYFMNTGAHLANLRQQLVCPSGFFFGE